MKTDKIDVLLEKAGTDRDCVTQTAPIWALKRDFVSKVIAVIESTNELESAGVKVPERFYGHKRRVRSGES